MKIASAHSVAIRKMEDTEADYALLLQWLTDDKILEFYGGRDHQNTLSIIKERYAPRIWGQVLVTPCFIEYEGKPVGYIQYYPTHENLPKELDPMLNEKGVFGIDMFVGNTELWGKGIGTAAIKLIIDYLFEEQRATMIFVDPAADNLRAIRTYEKAGFVKLKKIPGYETHEDVLRDTWLMICKQKAGK